MKKTKSKQCDMAEFIYLNAVKANSKAAGVNVSLPPANLNT